MVAVGAIDPNGGGSTGTGLSDVNSYVNLGGALNLPGSGRFNSGTAFAVLAFLEAAVGTTSDRSPNLADSSWWYPCRMAG